MMIERERERKRGFDTTEVEGRGEKKPNIQFINVNRTLLKNGAAADLLFSTE